MKVLGLTGGIGSGKSMVASMFAQLGADVIDADRLARDVVEPGQPALQEIASAFGRDILLSDGRLDRSKLGRIIFADPVARGTLNASHTALVGSPSRSQNWSPDALGNFSSVTSDGTTQTRSHNQQNEITSISGLSAPAYDANGNLSADGTGKT